MSDEAKEYTSEEVPHTCLAAKPCHSPECHQNRVLATVRALEAERAAHEETKRERDELAWAAVGALMVLDDMDRSSLEIESRRPRFAWDERALMREWARAAIAKAEGER